MAIQGARAREAGDDEPVRDAMRRHIADAFASSGNAQAVVERASFFPGELRQRAKVRSWPKL